MKKVMYFLMAAGMLTFGACASTEELEENTEEVEEEIEEEIDEDLDK